MEHIILIGDPGTGKSTLLTGLTGKPFASGMSTGTGKTTQLQTEVVNGVRYSDTPGLDDAVTKKRAAEEIAAAVRLGGTVKLLFVVTLEAARIRAGNMATIRTVVDALKEREVRVTGKFSVLINKMTPREKAMWTDAATSGPDLMRDILNDIGPVDRLAFMERVYALEDADNGKLPAQQLTVVRSLLTAMQTMDVPSGTSVEVKVDKIGELTAAFEAELKQTKAAHEAALAAAKKGDTTLLHEIVRGVSNVASVVALASPAAQLARGFRSLF
ncbi:hypothetical protein BU14_2080s0001 [Porphyra umbilicalis]|uniref:G domain-containing protein n=1 Tax=Porphyra umbilicalis TaxID=2786 RepID=A0A1X6NJX7_PORUM|nr:hypothetical protein BU14_2080s0001 [Porphyra umbilicalis]|eukprot:OSX68929.1 hypothetical protein BU14_2080s0001 [Porphyra umbilicalis]